MEEHIRLFIENLPSDYDTELTYIVLAQGTKFAKIGRSTKRNLRNRFSALQTSCPFPLTLLGVTTEKEENVHHRFQNERYRGEWFTYTEEMDEYFFRKKRKERYEYCLMDFIESLDSVLGPVSPYKEADDTVARYD